MQQEKTVFIEDYLVDDNQITVVVVNPDSTEIYTAPVEQLADYLDGVFRPRT